VEKVKTITYVTQRTRKRNSPFPLVRYVCGNLQRINDNGAVLERYVYGKWVCDREAGSHALGE